MLSRQARSNNGASRLQVPARLRRRGFDMNVGDGKKIRFYASIGMYWHESKCVFNFFYFVHICPCVCVHGSSFCMHYCLACAWKGGLSVLLTGAYARHGDCRRRQSPSAITMAGIHTSSFRSQYVGKMRYAQSMYGHTIVLYSRVCVRVCVCMTRPAGFPLRRRMRLQHAECTIECLLGVWKRRLSCPLSRRSVNCLSTQYAFYLL